MQDSIIDKINQSQEKKRPDFAVGDKVSVSVRLKEGDKERVQIFRGVVVVKHPKSGKGPGATFTVRKISAGVGVERIFPIHSPYIEKIEIDSSSDVRRSRLYFLRTLTGKKARLKEAERFGDALASDATPTSAEEVMTPAAAAEEAPKK
ncbi:50S ribosomal protein L19 [bacterium]|nr:50S ribosomal protein L19 [bacterium]